MHPDIPLLCKDRRGSEEIVEKMSKEVMLSLRGRKMILVLSLFLTILLSF